MQKKQGFKPKIGKDHVHVTQADVDRMKKNSKSVSWEEYEKWLHTPRPKMSKKAYEQELIQYKETKNFKDYVAYLNKWYDIEK